MPGPIRLSTSTIAPFSYSDEPGRRAGVPAAGLVAAGDLAAGDLATGDLAAGDLAAGDLAFLLGAAVPASASVARLDADGERTPAFLGDLAAPGEAAGATRFP